MISDKNEHILTHKMGDSFVMVWSVGKVWSEVQYLGQACPTQLHYRNSSM